MKREDYLQWPEADAERRKAARLILGRHLVRSLDHWNAFAGDALKDSSRYSPALPHHAQIVDWINSLTQEQKAGATTFVSEMLKHSAASILTEADGRSGYFLEYPYMEEIRISILVRAIKPDYEPGPPIEEIATNYEHEVDLDGEFWNWLKEFSRVP